MISKPHMSKTIHFNLTFALALYSPEVFNSYNYNKEAYNREADTKIVPTSNVHRTVLF